MITSKVSALLVQYGYTPEPKGSWMVDAIVYTMVGIVVFGVAVLVTRWVFDIERIVRALEEIRDRLPPKA